jgi:hypothetical protein
MYICDILERICANLRGKRGEINRRGRGYQNEV